MVKSSVMLLIPELVELNKNKTYANFVQLHGVIYTRQIRLKFMRVLLMRIQWV